MITGDDGTVTVADTGLVDEGARRTRHQRSAPPSSTTATSPRIPATREPRATDATVRATGPGVAEGDATTSFPSLPARRSKLGVGVEATVAGVSVGRGTTSDAGGSVNSAGRTGSRGSSASCASSSRTTSFIDGRSLGSFSSIRCTSASMAAGTVGRRSRSGGGALGDVHRDQVARALGDEGRGRRASRRT